MSAEVGGRWVRAATAACTVGSLALSSCSYAFVQEAPAGHQRLRHFDCTSTRLPPVLDTVGVGALTISAVANAVSPEAGNDAEDTMLTLGLAIAGATAFALSAGYGYVHTAECDDAKQALMRRLTQEAPPAPAPGTTAPAPAAQLRGCASDMNCKGTRICVEHVCVDPAAAPATPAPAPAPPSAAPIPAAPSP